VSEAANPAVSDQPEKRSVPSQPVSRPKQHLEAANFFLMITSRLKAVASRQQQETNGFSDRHPHTAPSSPNSKTTQTSQPPGSSCTSSVAPTSSEFPNKSARIAGPCRAWTFHERLRGEKAKQPTNSSHPINKFSHRNLRQTLSPEHGSTLLCAFSVPCQ
jgi:hypothetical protein